MTPLEKAQKEAVIGRISFAKVELNDLEAFQSMNDET